MIGTEGSFFGVLHIYAPKNMKINFHLSLTQIYLLVKYVGSECNKNQKDILSIDEVIRSLAIPNFFDHTLCELRDDT